MNTEHYIQDLLRFIEQSPSPYHTIESARKMLQAAGFLELSEKDNWSLQKGSRYFVVRGGSAIIAFTLPAEEVKGFHMAAAHSDSPSFKLKENPELTVEQAYTKLNVEKYGGMLMSTWFDRPLSIAGRVYISTKDGLEERLVCLDKDLLVIPNLAIHMNREANDGVKYSAQKDMCPVMGGLADKEMFRKGLAEELNVDSADILGQDLFLYVRQKGLVVGAKEDMLLSPRLDDLECAFAGLTALIEAGAACNDLKEESVCENLKIEKTLDKEKDLQKKHAVSKNYVKLCAVLDNEEVGSGTKQGADSDFLLNIMKRIVYGMGGTEVDYMQAAADSFMISADNAHALHPNYPEKADPSNRPVLNGGIVIKYSGNQKYTSDAYTGSRMKKLCMEAEVPYQVFFNHSDVLGGSTLGNISTSHVSVPSVDIGLAQLAMHSAVETAGAKDVEYLVRVLKHYFSH